MYVALHNTDFTEDLGRPKKANATEAGFWCLCDTTHPLYCAKPIKEVMDL